MNQTKTLGQSLQQKTTSGVYYIITVKIRSDARRATMRFDQPVATVIDARSQQDQRAREAEAALNTAPGRAVPLDQDLGPRGHSLYLKLWPINKACDAGTHRALRIIAPISSLTLEKQSCSDQLG